MYESTLEIVKSRRECQLHNQSKATLDWHSEYIPLEGCSLSPGQTWGRWKGEGTHEYREREEHPHSGQSK